MTIRSSLARLRRVASLALRAVPEIISTARNLVALDRLADPKQRYEGQFLFLHGLASKWGFQIYNRHSAWVDDEEFWSTFRRCPDLQNHRGDRKFVVWSLARYASSIPGDTAECGVLGGGSSYLICDVFKNISGHRHHVFDSFQGLSNPTPEDTPISRIAPRWQAGDLSVPLETVKGTLSQFRSVHYYPGWIPQRFEEVADVKFSFVHIDVDLYQPTKDSLEFFYPRLAEGGILLCDDYGSHQCMGARRAFDDFALAHATGTVVHLPTTQGFIVKRR